MRIEPMTLDMVKSVYFFIQAVELEDDVFIKSTEKEISEKVKESIVCFDDGELIGVLLKVGSYIDTVVSTKGCGRKMIKSLGEGYYLTNISSKNTPSIKMFRKLGFGHVGDEILCGQKRGKYAGYIR